ncbi:PREDICTED: copine-5-like [Myotis brandtii]|uniref:copine-5-like n=1 Tax=Myotis brandtii TaxID=109478 RepID=UPI000703E27D|nr:PREDICTED: copine-5-like [Myotis brandtii]
MSPYQLNAYALALTAVGEIIQHYDSDKMFPALGFGAKLPPDGRVSHEFPLNGNQDNPSCCGIDGILEAYHQSLRTVQLYGPTNFAPVVTHVARNAAEVQDGSQYSVLLIITDGVISDMAQTKEAIVNAAKLPMSIIIIGVGQAEFDAMVELDGDEVRISSRGKLAERDIVQFVPFRDYVDRTGNHVLSMARLARDVLAEIPDQLVSYMKAKGIRPRPVMHAGPSCRMGLRSPLNVLCLGVTRPHPVCARHRSLPVMHDGGVSTLSGPVPVSESLCVEFALN